MLRKMDQKIANESDLFSTTGRSVSNSRNYPAGRSGLRSDLPHSVALLPATRSKDDTSSPSKRETKKEITTMATSFDFLIKLYGRASTSLQK
jgi:hypothetical protein